MKKRQIMAFVLAATMAATAVTGCGAPSRPDGSGDTGSTDSSSDSGEESKDGVVQLTFMGWEASPLETQAVKDGIAAFEKENPNIKVNYTPGLAGSEYNAKLL